MLKFSQLQIKFIHYPLNQEEKVRELHIMKVMLKKVISTAVRMYGGGGGVSKPPPKKKKLKIWEKGALFP